ncbi:uncharacterized protein LOC130754862 [Actinidia eriantha]|uniref:uncharacterized protein LOC130754862 n=1 Tax=Actinidia eriantha TaxID=165200 RepID=UPI002586DB45|nr:uncharacterized protein LOC130754862 [Actinidia eriantha]
MAINVIWENSLKPQNALRNLDSHAVNHRLNHQSTPPKHHYPKPIKSEMGRKISNRCRTSSPGSELRREIRRIVRRRSRRNRWLRDTERGFCMLDLFDQVKREKLGERITALQQLIRHRYFMKRWDISGFCRSKFRCCVLLICNVSLLLSTSKLKKERMEKQ